jgi:hypothetical protein
MKKVTIAQAKKLLNVADEHWACLMEPSDLTLAEFAKAKWPGFTMSDTFDDKYDDDDVVREWVEYEKLAEDWSKVNKFWVELVNSTEERNAIFWACYDENITNYVAPDPNVRHPPFRGVTVVKTF